MLLNKNPDDIKNMFNKIANRYDFMNNIISFGVHNFVKKKTINDLKISNNARVLDLCCGSGDLGRIVYRKNKNAEIIGVDFSVNMLKIAKERNPKIEYIEADATNLPFLNETFDYVLMGFGLRNIQDYNLALSEINRVLKNGGKFLHLDFNSDSIFKYVYDKLISLIVNIFSKDKRAYLYLLRSKNLFFSPNRLIQLFEKHKFRLIKNKKILFNIISYQIMSKD